MPTVRITTATAELRGFESDEPAAFADFDAFAQIVYMRHPHVVRLAGLRGTLSRALMREIVATLSAMGVTEVYAERAPQRRLPYATRVASGDFIGMWRVDVAEVLKGASA